MTLATFIIPTIGRPTLKRTLDSLIYQTDQDWQAIVVVDHVGNFELPVNDPRIFVLRLGEKLGRSHFSGHVRNYGMEMAMGEWCGFVDDDDRLDEHYVEWLRQEGDGNDLLVFRMKYSPPREDAVELLPRSNHAGGMKAGEVGISFAVRTQFQREHDLLFPSEEFEDWLFIKRALDTGARCKISDCVAYYIRH
jgi:glycosyltransferase involved in cell wall biosynthesis